MCFVFLIGTMSSRAALQRTRDQKWQLVHKLQQEMNVLQNKIIFVQAELNVSIHDYETSRLQVAKLTHTKRRLKIQRSKEKSKILFSNEEI